VRYLREAAQGLVGSDYSKKPARTSAGFRFDYFFSAAFLGRYLPRGFLRIKPCCRATP